MIVVSDTSAISNLAVIGQLALLHKLYGEIVIPSAVYQELLNADITNPASSAIQTLDWVQIRSITNIALFQTLHKTLDLGEAEAITLAVELNADRLIIDERRGRKAAIASGVQVIGLLGILLAAKRQGLIGSVQLMLDELINRGFWVQTEVYEEILKLAGE
ncbi:DUF3368 domain-containing protein [Tumidithrix elongata RA019]|uniref:DUF3368 domain-containing protein n=1 Tax=Tumidithrix elongata BACA0141 TaxID=2716417 RepID=A0AAW9Q711_9CYAN|nr:DUF3368 domain-containing protein [Tumidithrix elongata RA019]